MVRETGIPRHICYDLGSPRLGCAGCIFNSDRQVKIEMRENPHIFEAIDRLETEIGYTMSIRGKRIRDRIKNWGEECFFNLETTRRDGAASAEQWQDQKQVSASNVRARKCRNWITQKRMKRHYWKSQKNTMPSTRSTPRKSSRGGEPHITDKRSRTANNE